MLVKTYGREGLQHRQIKWNVNLPQDEKCTSTGQKFITLSNNCFTSCSGIFQIHCTIQTQIQKQITKLHCCFTSSSCRTIRCPAGLLTHSIPKVHLTKEAADVFKTAGTVSLISQRNNFMRSLAKLCFTSLSPLPMGSVDPRSKWHRICYSSSGGWSHLGHLRLRSIGRSWTKNLHSRWKNSQLIFQKSHDKKSIVQMY